MENFKVAIIGLGYVGLPLAVESGKKYDTLGFDISNQRISELKNGIDRTLEVDSDEINLSRSLSFGLDPEQLAGSNFYIVTVPTPIDKNNKPDLTPIENASRTIGKFLKPGDIVVYESTVYPGCTEEVCVPILERESGLSFNKDFFCGYSPERINPGDKERRITNILKVTSGSTPAVADRVDSFYQSIITAGTHKASSIKVAEASKVIENTQRDINIAFINELAIIFDKLGLNTLEVLEAAGTKWNFLPFRPGLVGGHCIGVDPYYLTYKAESVGYIPEIILAGRRINDNMGKFIATDFVKLMAGQRLSIVCADILVLGITFKENCPDIRNSKAVSIIDELENYNANIEVYDPVADPEEVYNNYGFHPIKTLGKKYTGVIVAVAHNEFNHLDLKSCCQENHIIYDIKGILPAGIASKVL